MKTRMICFQHRLAGMAGHRFNQAVGLLAEAERRGMEPLLLMNAAADEEVRRALPGRAVLHDPVFRLDLSFDERTRAFVAMLHEQVDADTRRDDWLLLTVATQCEARALAAWLAELPEAKRPWTVALFLSDRWNRSAAAVGAGDHALAGPGRREQQLEELRVVGRDLAAHPEAVRRRLLLCTHTEGLRDELAARLGAPLFLVPMLELAQDIAPREGQAVPARPDATPRIAVLGGARPEKGSHLLPAIVAASRRLARVEFFAQLVNEQMTAEAFADLERRLGDLGVATRRGPLDRAAYVAELVAADLVLLPYERSAYRQRQSGVFSEAVVAGVPLVVPEGTWMAQQVAAGAAAGVAFEGEGPEPIAVAIAQAAAGLTALAARARSLSPAWRLHNTMPAFVDRIASEIAARAAGGKMPPVSRLRRALAAPGRLLRHSR